MKFQGSSGLRGVWNDELIEAVRKIAMNIGNKYKEVLVANDYRTTSDAIAHLAAGYLMAYGSNVHYGGYAPTPSLAHGAKRYDLGVMITASHNPPQYNGIKLFNPDGSAMVDLPQGDVKVSPWDEVGKLSYENVVEEHRNALLKNSQNLDLKIVIDCANGATSVLTPFIFRDLGARVISINCHPDGHFPGHPSEPTAENLKDLVKLVKGSNADLGVAHDGDGDRFIAVTGSGRILSGDEILAIFTIHYKFKRIVAPVDSSMLLDNFARVVRCKVGDANVSQVMKSAGIKFGGENSGTQIFADWLYAPDAIYAAIKFAEIVMSEDIDAMVAEFPRYHTLRRNIEYVSRDDIKRKIENFVRDYDVDRTDGYRVKMEDSWFLIRFSGTEPKVRVTVESTSMEKARRVMEQIIAVLKS